MKILLLTILSAVTLSAAIPAIASPDFQALEQARKAASHTGATPEARDKNYASKKLILPLDHGPHAQTTPYLNQLRRQYTTEHSDTTLK